MDGPIATSLPFLLRAAETVSACIAFAVVTTYDGSSKIDYIMFTGISGMVLAVLFAVLYVARMQKIRGLPSALIDGVWWVFWLAAAALTTSMLTTDSWNTDRMRASCAFCWISWVLWSASLLISIQEARGYEY